ncbi:Ubiquinol-cytochrome c reductase iron-sulfur subunit [Shimia thalassica]|uniref:Ubiquinol-cytochrome c reductase iron-sulfur subunit n=2 Tax=Shimia thalassica TaxID=1715693 RepID=A0A0P1I6W2_9RHOB|nr:Ubiquinol-cytochrome c reductase iron-sulfur subunit [Shimia thalassica]
MRRPNTLYRVTTAAVVFSLILGIVFIARTGLPSADVIARQEASRPIIKVSDFNPGDVEIISLNNRRVIVWRRNETDRTLAASQNAPEGWRHQNSRVLGQAQTVFADDTNVTLEGEWFFALAEFSNPYQHLILRSGDFEGFFEGLYAGHFDLAGRIRIGGGSTNLTVIKAEYVDDGQGIQLYLDGKP